MRSSIPLLIVFATACHSESSENRAAPVQSTVASSASVAQPQHHRREVVDAGVDALCKTLLAEEKLDETALNEEDRSRPGPRMRCMSTGTFAWAIRLDKADAGSSIRQTLLFAGPDNARARQVSTLEGIEWPPVFGRHAAMYDFDNDGVPELVASISKDVRTFAPAARIFVTVKKNAIAPYPVAGGYKVDAAVDMDKDGRPDLRISYDLGKRTVCSPADEGRVEVELAAHALPDGKFSVDDAVAKSFAEKRCPAMPSADALFTPTITGSPDERDLSLQTIACERMRGKTAEAVVSEIQTACAPSAGATQKCSGPCRHLKDALAVANFQPPIQLK
jgi:hypothetical protein